MNETVEAWNDVLAFLYDRIDYERQDTPQRTRGFKLDRMRELLRRLGNPQDSLPIIHIAGTKGKGSTAHMIASVIDAAGLRCGLYTSPHLENLEERFIIQGTACSTAKLRELVELVRPAVVEMEKLAENGKQQASPPTFFEIITAMALLYFHQQRVDLAVIEVGLGGRLDSTNVCQPRVSVITSISYDHVHLLGNTLSLIAREKAGIIKPGIPIVSGVLQEEPRTTIQKIAEQQGAPLWNIQDDFRIEDCEQKANQTSRGFNYLVKVGSQTRKWPNLEVGLKGEHQRNNALVALAALACLQEQGWDIPNEAVYDGLANVRCPARIETVAEHPTVLIDTAHNPASIESLVKYLKTETKSARNILIFAASNDKDAVGMLQLLLPVFDVVILTRYITNPRALTIIALEQQCQRALDLATDIQGDQTIPFIESCEDPSAAWNRAAELAATEDRICITGSFYLAGEIRSLVIGNAVSHVTS